MTSKNLWSAVTVDKAERWMMEEHDLKEVAIVGDMVRRWSGLLKDRLERTVVLEKRAREEKERVEREREASTYSLEEKW